MNSSEVKTSHKTNQAGTHMDLCDRESLPSNTFIQKIENGSNMQLP